MFVLEQNNTAKKLTGQILINDLLAALDGHGGISSVEKTGTSLLEDTYTITYADTTTSTFTVTNGKGISSITWSTSGTSGDGQIHTGTISYNDNTSSTVEIKDGVKGDTGDDGQDWYVWIKYAAVQPTSDADMGETPDEWMGVYSGNSSTAPTAYTSYQWFQIKGAKGDTGDASTVTSATWYMESASGTTIPENGWSSIIPTVSQGNYLWTKTVLTFNDGNSSTFYSVARQGVDGEGQVDEVAANLADTFSDASTYAVGDLVLYNRTMYKCTTAISVPDAWDGNDWEQVNLTDVVDDSKPRYFTANVAAATNSTIATISDPWITGDTVVLECRFVTPQYITSNVSWSSSAGSITFTGTCTAATSMQVVLANKGN